LLFHNVDWSLKKSWGAAREDCISRGANLVSIHNQEEEEFLSKYNKGSTKWIGLKHNPIEGGGFKSFLIESFCNLGYSWSDGSPVTHTNWGIGEPNNHEGREECIEMVSNTNGTVSWWNDLNCDAHQDWICMIAKGKTPIIPPVPPPPVPGKLLILPQILLFTKMPERIYQSECGLFASPDFVASYLRDLRFPTWIGLSDQLSENQYAWSDNSPVLYTNWNENEPNNAGGAVRKCFLNR
uniref:C-type lectin domain-containing protein n=1 Tax=Kryptolebias marmoratus TaxID=37003 RepID=A0A3Q3B1T1_KRYMA